MPVFINRQQVTDYYAKDAATTVDAPRLGALINLHVVNLLREFLHYNPEADLMSVGRENNRWELFARAPDRFDESETSIERLEQYHNNFSNTEIEKLHERLKQGKVGYLLANPAVAAQVDQCFKPVISARAFLAQSALENLPASMRPTLNLPDHPAWTEAKLEELHDQLCDRLGLNSAVGQRNALKEVIDDLPQANEDVLVKKKTPTPSRPRASR